MRQQKKIPYVHVAIAAGGLGTRRSEWTRYLPKEYFPVGGKPGIALLLEEVAKLGRVRAVLVHHPYYADFISSWARPVLENSHHGHGQIFGIPLEASAWSGVELRFTPQRGPYGDVTSVLNADDALGRPDELYIAYADNLYPEDDPLPRLSSAGPGTSVLARAYRGEEVSQRGVLVTEGGFVSHLVEKPSAITAQELERRFGVQNLALLEGRARADRAFLDFLHGHAAPHGAEPKLSLALAAYVRINRVRVCLTTSPVTDLGAPLRNT